MRKALINLESTLVDGKRIVRPYASELIEGLKEEGFQVFIITSAGIEYAKRLYEMLGLPSVHGFLVKGLINLSYEDIVIDSNPSFMKMHVGYCIYPWSSEDERQKEDTELYRVLNEIKSNGEYPAG